MGLIFLTGMPGAGKSAVGEQLAGLLDWTFLDLDAEIVVRVGETIPEIFSRNGEPHFRDLEAAALKDALTTSGTVIALGAGALERDESLAQVTTNGTLIYLRAEIALLLERNLKVKSRPLLSAARSESDMRNQLEQLLRRREHGYLSASVIVDVDPSQTPAMIASHILARLRRSERV